MGSVTLVRVHPRLHHHTKLARSGPLAFRIKHGTPESGKATLGLELRPTSYVCSRSSTSQLTTTARVEAGRIQNIQMEELHANPYCWRLGGLEWENLS